MSILTHLRVMVIVIGLAGVIGQKPAPPQATQQQIDAAIDKGAQFLLASYAERFAAGQMETLNDVGRSALSLYAMLKGGIPKDDPTVRRLLFSVMRRPILRTYDATCVLLALSAHDPSLNRRAIEELARKLIGWQMKGGDWSYPYPAGGGDLSNTQYAALGLWVAATDGVSIPASVWTRLANAVLAYQSADGGFGYVTTLGEHGAGTGSMTAAGVATLAMCEIELRVGGNCAEEFSSRLTAARSRGIEWLAKNFSVTTNPKAGAWLLYYLYGLERLGAVCGVARIGAHDWYAEGADQLVAEQTEKGSWQNATDFSDTSFAILFLKRATRRGPATGEAAVSTDSDVPVTIASTGSGPVRVWLAHWNKQLSREIEWAGERGQGPHVTRVEYMVDGKLAAVQLGDGSRAAFYERFDATVVFESPGVHRVKARLFVLAPDKNRKSVRVIESQELEIDVQRALPRWIGELELDLGPNLAPDPKARVKASSQLSVKDAPLGLEFPGEAVLDDICATPWLADPKDDQRTLTISWIKAVECDVIRVSPAVLPAFGIGYLSRPIEVEIEVNGQKKQRMAMDPDPLHPIRLELDRKTAIRRLDVRILSVATSTESPLVGIAEVELFCRKD